MRLLLVIALLLLLVPACRHESLNEQTLPVGLESPAVAEQLGAIPFPDGSAPDRSPSAVDRLWVAGRQAYLESSGTLIVGDTMVLSAGPGVLTWAVYELYPGDFPLEQVHSNVSGVTSLDNLYYGIANYGRQAWDWHTAIGGGPTLSVVGRNVVSPGGGLYLCIASWDDASATVHEVWVENDVPEWGRYPLNPFGLSGELHSTAMIGDSLAVLIQDPTGIGNYDLFYYYATEPLPASEDWVPTAVEIGIPAPNLALELIDCGGGRPAFANITAGNQLYYRYSSDLPPVGAVSWNPTFVDLTQGPELGLAIAGGNPAVAYTGESTHGGEAVMYARAATPLPVAPLWDRFTVAESLNPAQEYAGLDLAVTLGDTPCVVYYNDLAHNMYFWTSGVVLPDGPEDVITAPVNNPSLGGAAWPTVVNYTGHAALIYDSVNSVIPQYAWADAGRPESTAEWSNRHRVTHMSADMPAVATRGGTIGIAFRDYRDGSIKYAWYDSDDPVGDGKLNSGADWRIVTVDERQTVGKVSLVYAGFGLPTVGYTVSADGLFYLAHIVPTS